jgi:hypothetical protein
MEAVKTTSIVDALPFSWELVEATVTVKVWLELLLQVCSAFVVVSKRKIDLDFASSLVS